MDVVTELTARLTAYIGLLQDALALFEPETAGLEDHDFVFKGPMVLRLNSHRLAEEEVGPEGLLWQKFYDYPRLLADALELAVPEKNLVSYKNKPGGGLHKELENDLKLFARQAHQLLDNVLLPHKDYLVEKLTDALSCHGAEERPHVKEFLPPEQWRRAIRSLLYEKTRTRLALVKALGRNENEPYEPILVLKAQEIIADRKGLNKKLLQKQEELKLYVASISGLPHKESKGSDREDHLVQLQEQVSLLSRYVEGLTPQLKEELLVADSTRDEVLRIGECALPFEVVFRQELEEIRGRRKVTGIREKVFGAGNPEKAPDHPDDQQTYSGDALQGAATLQLWGLAFSGGGIRSATFNLGILQGLASQGWLTHFDYLSTVSGGSYLGSWFTAWVKRAGSLQKVITHLRPDLSPEPRAEEVRPIRWLRMYSNYLAPNPSIMSTDSWTLGVTWLRNALLNQIIMVLALGAVLAFGVVLLQGWQSLDWKQAPFFWQALLFLFLILGAGLAGLGMSMFRTGHKWPPKLKVQLLVVSTVIMALTCAFLVSGLLYKKAYPGFAPGFGILKPAILVGALSLLLVAMLGRYDRCFFAADDHKKERVAKQVLAWLAISVASLAAAALGLVALVLVWKMLHGLHPPSGSEGHFVMKLPPTADGKPLIISFPYVDLAFVFGLPLVLEVLVVTVVVRMALLGSNFPDERREWWGRMGAVIHLAAVAWLVLTGSLLLSISKLPVWMVLKQYVMAKIVVTGWVALVISAVQFAYSSRTPAQPGKPGASNWLEKITSLGPYAFGLGLLLLTGATVHFLLDWLLVKLPQWGLTFFTRTEVAMGLGGLLGGLALLLSWRVEVNEFSLHHFYRNRLGRAYLGASRRRTERNKTANPFTSFDRRDDLKICTLRQRDPLSYDQTYNGPYLIINTTLNTTQVTDLAQQDRKAESFVFTPHYCGFDFARVRAINPKQPSFDFGYRPTQHFAYPQDNGPALGTAMTISGAATNPNRGYHSSPASAFMLALFNVRLGWWMGNPRREDTWGHAAPRLGLLYLLSELFGQSNTSSRYVNLSDGGHFDNMGLYELLRRRCRYIVLGDGEEDHLFTCEGLANAIRRCRVDFGVEIKIDVTPITNREDNYSKRHFAVGTIRYADDLPGDRPGYLLYLKTSLTDDEPADVREYAKKNETFPHQSTQDQFFDESQFESYRRLGLHVVEQVFLNLKNGQDPDAAFGQLLQDSKVPPGPDTKEPSS